MTMHSSPSDPSPLRPGARLPALRLPRADGAGEVALRAGHGRGSVVYIVPEREDEASRSYREALESAGAMLGRWKARLLVVLPGRGAEPAGGGEARRVSAAVDDGGILRRRLGIDPAEGTLLVADEWGVLYAAERSSDPGRLPDAGEISDWLRFIATQCPECGVPDEPGRGEWARG